MNPEHTKKVLKNPVAVICSAISLFLISQILGVAIASLFSPYIKNQTLQLFLIISCSLLVLIGLIMTAMHVFKFMPRAIGWVKPKAKTLWLIAPTFVLYFLISGTFLFIAQKYIPSFKADQTQDVGFNNLQHLPQLVVGFVSLVILTPIFEETIFRGILFKGLRRRWPFWVSALLTSGIFAVAHFQWNVAVDVFALSLMLCYLTEKSESVVPGIILHALKNSVAFIILFIYK